MIHLFKTPKKLGENDIAIYKAMVKLANLIANSQGVLLHEDTIECSNDISFEDNTLLFKATSPNIHMSISVGLYTRPRAS